MPRGNYLVIFRPKRRINPHENVAMGFVDGSGVFHPIRASEDYSRAKAGETWIKRRAAAKKKKTAKKKPRKKRR
jgi:hypothetical protein